MPKGHYKDNDIKGPGDYRISEVILYSYAGLPIDISDTIVSMDIYESIYSNCITGSITFADTQGLTERTPIIGKEYLEFKFRTPIEYKGDGGEYSAMSGDRFAVFNLSAKQISGGQSQIITLEFTSLENLRSARLRVSKAFTGSYDKAINEIYERSWGLNSQKKLYLEPCSRSQKYVVPNLHPLDAINDICSRALSKKTSSPGFFFYETSQGFHFRSLDSMLRQYSNEFALSPQWEYDVSSAYKPAPQRIGVDPIALMQRVYSFGFDSQYNQLNNAKKGSYSSRLLAHDSYNKTITDKEFNYQKAKDYLSLPHMHSKLVGAMEMANQMAITPAAPADLKDDGLTGGLVGGRTSEEYTDGHIMVQSSTTNVHNDNDGTNYHVEEYLQKRVHLLSLLDAIKITLQVPGNTHLNAGNIVKVKIPAYTTELHEKGGSKRYDRFLSGNYLIVQLRHTIDARKHQHRTIMTLSKETYGYPLRSAQNRPENKTTQYAKGAINIETGIGYGIDEQGSL